MARQDPQEAKQPLRADAERNRRVLLDAAAAVLAEKGLNVPVSDIAREAGLGKATVFRHFPAKESLLAAVIEDQLSQLAALGQPVARNENPADGNGTAESALRDLFTQGARLLAENRGICQAMAASLGHPEVAAAVGRLMTATRDRLAKAQQAGAVRKDVTAEDLILLQRAVAETAAPLQVMQPRLWQRYVDLAWDSLRPEKTAELSEPPPVFPL